MGVTGLWSILEPVRETVPLYSLAGKTLVVDLSLWVCEAQSVKEMAGRVTKPHLRNLFFRVLGLTLMGIKLIFVMEGEAPKIKADTMSKRSELRFGQSKKGAATTSRSRFKFILKECSEMLDCLGVPWVTAQGEAEAMCAFMDSSGFADGCVTNDGDVFLYGGQRVYRNFNMNTKDPQVDCYRMERVRSELHLERETLVGLAILLGCDYIPKGIPGAGKEQTLKLIQTLNGQTLLQKFNQWTEGSEEEQRKPVKNVTHCLVCRHPGSAKTHEKSGCRLCDSRQFCEPRDYDYCCPCEWHQTERIWKASSVESSIKRKALATKGFPFTEIINEYLVPKDRAAEGVTRKKPNLLQMQTFALAKMEWPKHYTSEKLLALMTYTDMMNIRCGRKSSTQLQPLRIRKSRIRNGIPSFEVVWKKPDHYVHANDHPEEGFDTVTTIEEESLFRCAHPNIVARFLEEKAEAERSRHKQKKHRNRRKEMRPEVSDGVSDLLAVMTVHCSAEENTPSMSQGPSLCSGDVGSSRNGLEPLDCLQPSMQGRSGSGVSKGAAVGVLERPGAPTPTGQMLVTSFSPSVTMAVEELHLSNIDWGAQSFAASPQVRGCERMVNSQAEGFAGTQENTPTSSDELQMEGLWSRRPAGVSHKEPFNVQPAPGSSDGCLKHGILMKNATEHGPLQDKNTMPVAYRHQSECLQPVQTSRQGPRQPGVSNTMSTAYALSEPPQMYDKKDVRGAAQTDSHSLDSPDSKIQTSDAMRRKAKDKHMRNKPLPKHKFVKSHVTSVWPQQSSSKPGDHAYRDRRIQAIKESVCISLLSSSDDSDVENMLVDKWKKASAFKSRSRFPHPAKDNLKTSEKETSIKIKGDVEIVDPDVRAVASDGLLKERNAVVIPAKEFTDLIPCCSSQACSSERADPVIPIDSPLPLAERLKLKFM